MPPYDLPQVVTGWRVVRYTRQLTFGFVVRSETLPCFVSVGYATEEDVGVHRVTSGWGRAASRSDMCVIDIDSKGPSSTTSEGLSHRIEHRLACHRLYTRC